MNSVSTFGNFIPKANSMHAQACLDARSTISTEEALKASIDNVRGRASLYRDNQTRAQWRNLFAVAHKLPDCVVVVTYVKDLGDIRTMLCNSIGENSDATARYVTVWDIQLGAYRRVNLDAVIQLQLNTGAMPSQVPDAVTKH